MVQQLFRSRGQRTYFDAVKQPVEEACGRRFTVRDHRCRRRSPTDGSTMKFGAMCSLLAAS